MRDDTDDPEGNDIEPADATDAPAWDAGEVMRARAAATRRERDVAIGELRGDMSDEQILDEYGVDLSQIEE